MVSTVEKVSKTKSDIENPEQQYDYQFQPFAMFPLPPQQPKDGKFLKKLGDHLLEITASSRFGVPYGRDILPILYLIREALLQGGPVIKFRSMKHFLDTFRIKRDPRVYREMNERFRRIFYATWFWDDQRNPEIDKGVSFRIIKAWNVNFSTDEDQRQLPGLDANTIILDDNFWQSLQTRKLPYVLEDVIALKNKPLTLSLYLFLVYRTYINWVLKEGPKTIPLFKENGLLRQISAGTQHRGTARREMEKCLDEIRDIWPDLPVEFSRRWEDPRQRRPNGIVIDVQDVSQLRVPPHEGKLLGEAIREGKKLNKAQYRPGPDVPCPECGSTMHRNKDQYDTRWPANYLRCRRCNHNYYVQDHAREHPDWFPGYNIETGRWNYNYQD